MKIKQSVKKQGKKIASDMIDQAREYKDLKGLILAKKLYRFFKNN